MKSIFYDKDIFAENLSTQMGRLNEKQQDIAALLGVSKSTVSAYCSGKQMPRMDKVEQLARHFGVSCSSLLERSSGEVAAEPARPRSEADWLYDALNESGQNEFLRYGRYLASQDEYKASEAEPEIIQIKHYIVPAAAGYASPIEGEDYELVELPADAPIDADFSIDIQGDSMEPYIHDGQRIYVKRDAPLLEFDVGIFFVDGDVFCKQWCTDYAGTLHLLSANERRQDANITIRRDSGRSCVCFGKVLLNIKLPKPIYI